MTDDGDTREWHVGPPQAGYWEWRAASITLSVINQLPARLQRTRVVNYAMTWALEVCIGSRVFTEVSMDE